MMLGILAHLLLDLRNLTEKRKVKVLNILARTQFGVAGLHCINDADRYTDTKYKRYQINHLRNRLVWSLASVRTPDNLYILSCKGTRELVLLLLLEQEQIELLLDSLLAAMSTQIIYLLRVGRNIRIVGRFLLVEICYGCLKSLDLCLKRRHYTLMHGAYTLIEIHNHRVGDGTVGNKRVTMHHSFVIVSYLTLDIHAAVTQIHGKRLELVSGFFHIIPKILSHLEIV